MTLRLASCIVGVTATITLATGCGAARPSKYYQLTIPGDISPSTSPSVYPVTIVVGALTSSDLYREDRIVYGAATEQMGTYEYQRWAEPPTEMLRDVLLRALRASGLFRRVYSQRSAMRGDYLLRGRLYDFKELTANSLSARVALDLELRDEKSGSIVWTHFYSYDQPVNGKDVAAVVSAMNQNVHRGLAEIQASLDQYFATHAQPIP